MEEQMFADVLSCLHSLASRDCLSSSADACRCVCLSAAAAAAAADAVVAVSLLLPRFGDHFFFTFGPHATRLPLH